MARGSSWERKALREWQGEMDLHTQGGCRQLGW